MSKHNREKYPAIWAEFEKAQERKAVLMKKRSKFVAEMKAIFQKRELDNERLERLGELADQDREEIKEVCSEISRMAQAMGAKRLSLPLDEMVKA